MNNQNGSIQPVKMQKTISNTQEMLSIKLKLLKIDTILFSTKQNKTIYAEKQNTAIESKKGHG